jgi:predicted acylesterase/phospholipase RssA
MNSSVKKLGLALSGGGFRASLYHLGLVRFLRDAGTLSQVNQITSVSGGSIFAAHLVLNWDRYNGSPNEFDAAASEFLSFVDLDVRNRITRRFPLALPLRLPRRLLGLSNRKLTRTGLLEYHYETCLYGDVSLFDLPEKPQLHLLATNLSEGCLCSFNRDGLLMVRRQPGGALRLDRIHVGLATVAMAVTASSAFPGFFPPVELTGTDVGASVGEFGRQAYTDGGVFDNLGVRMFRCLERQLLADSPLSRDDFVDFPATFAALRQASTASEDTAMRRLAHILVAACRRPGQLLLPNTGTSGGAGCQLAEAPGQAASLPQAPEAWNGESEELVLSGLSHVLRHYHFQLDPLFVTLKLVHADADAVLQSSRLGARVLPPADQLWLNRHLLEAAFRQATGRACFRRLHSGLDGVLVSDVGKPIEVQSNRRAGGLIRTALRATDILMDRVWQLEIETFRDAPGFVFAPITEVVEPAEDATALHPEIQRQTANLRTDLDRFSPLEISSLVRHGYCVGRKACRAHPDLFGADLPGNAPWDPIPAAHGAAPPVRAAAQLNGALQQSAPATVEARTLQTSAFRRIWSTLLDYRDWVSYIYVPLILPIIILLPYLINTWYKSSHVGNQLIQTFAQGNYELELLTRLLEKGPDKPWTGVPAEEVRNLGYLDFNGYEVVQRSYIFDLHKWIPGSSAKAESSSMVHIYQRIKMDKLLPTAAGNYRVPLIATSPKTQVRFPKQQLEATVRMSHVEGLDVEEKETRWEASFDFHSVPVGDYVDLFIETQSPGQFINRGENGASIISDIYLPTAQFVMWILMPEGKEYRGFRITRYQTGKPEKVEPVKPVTEYLADDYTILAFKLQSLKPGYTYEVSWFYR